MNLGNLNFLLCPVVYTDKLAEVRAFYARHFKLPIDESVAHSVMVFFYPQCALQFIDAAWAGVSPSRDQLFRFRLPLTALEYERLTAEGVPTSELSVEPWGGIYGAQVQCFTITDPSGTRIQIFEDHFGEARQLMATGEGVDTRKAQQKQE